MPFDATINLGNALTLLTVVVGLAGLYFGMIRRLDKLEYRVRLLWAMMRQHSEFKDLPWNGE